MLLPSLQPHLTDAEHAIMDAFYARGLVTIGVHKSVSLEGKSGGVWLELLLDFEPRDTQAGVEIAQLCAVHAIRYNVHMNHDRARVSMLLQAFDPPAEQKEG